MVLRRWLSVVALTSIFFVQLAIRRFREPCHLDQALGRGCAMPGNHNETAVRAVWPADNDPLCAHMPDTRNILLVMKTGASESFARLPTQLLTTLRCIPHDDVLLLSDLAQDIAVRPVHDGLAFISPDVRTKNPEFNIYNRQQECLVSQAICHKLSDDVARQSWYLDKYKNVYAAELAWRERPGYDWYVFVDADTYVSWGGLVALLRQLSPQKRLYLGNTVLMWDYDFNHGGSGYVLSAAAMDALLSGGNISHTWYAEQTRDCCGDHVMAAALATTSQIRPTTMRPTFEGEKPITLSYGPTHWCHPVVTMHHMDSEEISAVWNWERQRPANAPLMQMRDLYTNLIAHKLLQQARRDDWDNQSDDRYYVDPKASSHPLNTAQMERIKPANERSEIEQTAHLGPDECARACESQPGEECFQWRWSDGVCATRKGFTLGFPVKRPEAEKGRSFSGWELDKIRNWVEAQGECGEIRFPMMP